MLKKIKEHHKKKAKELKRKGSGRAAKPKDLGIPSSWPFKEQLMQEMAFAKERAEAALLARREAAKQRRVRLRRRPGAAAAAASRAG